MYKPPFSISVKMLSLCVSIAEKAEKLGGYSSLSAMPTLRHNNKIKSIQSSLAIEANSLSLDQVVDVIADKPVIGPRMEVQEVKNAYTVYSHIHDYDAYSETDLLKAHYGLMHLIDDGAGEYRGHGEGVTDGEKVIFVAPGPEMVPQLMRDLFCWLRSDEGTHILIKSCVFHYEFVFIHPFSDGNGRLARLWQNVLLTTWNPIFEFIPIESQIAKYQAEYYGAINQCHLEGKSDVFVEFMLRMIDATLTKVLSSAALQSRNISYQVGRLLDVMEKGIPMSANEIMSRLGVKSKETLRASYINPALENGLIKMTLPDKPKSKNQRYVKGL